jgi:hypothetical protein
MAACERPCTTKQGLESMSDASQRDAFVDRARAMEDAFFRQRDQQLMESLRDELSEMEERHRLAHVSGVLDPRVLKDLVEAGVTSESLLAMRLIPMLAVAWADRSLSDGERDAILHAAREDRIAPDSTAYRMLQDWLKQPPDARVVAAWKAYAIELTRVSSPETVAALRERHQRLCQTVAEASGGFFGIGAESAMENKKIKELLKAYDVQ